MTVFLTWMGMIGGALALYIFILWRRHKNRSRFGAKLTIFFLLFVLIPVIPLILFTASLLTRSADLLLLPGMDTALETSLATLKEQVETRGIQFIKSHPDPQFWTLSQLETSGIDMAGMCQYQDDGWTPTHMLRHSRSPLPETWCPGFVAFADSLPFASHTLNLDAGPFLMVFHLTPDSSLIMAGYTPPPPVIAARDQILRALDVYSTLSLLKESIIQKNLIWGLAVLIVLSLAGIAVQTSKRLSRSIDQPVQDLVKGMRQVANGDLNIQVNTRAKDEFKFLVHTFNTMVHDLETSREKLVLAERMAAWRDVARQISHEIKNSLTPLAISLRRLKKNWGDASAPGHESLTLLEKELKSLETVASEFSQFARMPRPQKAPLNMNEVITSVVHLLRPSAGSVILAPQLADALPQIAADWEQMKRLMNNLIQNAVDASSPRSTVTISSRPVSANPHTVEVEIRDTGEGMSPDIQKKIFQPYFTSKKKGTGLGMAIVRQIVDDHDGAIEIHSQPGEGTTVCLRF